MRKSRGELKGAARGAWSVRLPKDSRRKVPSSRVEKPRLGRRGRRKPGTSPGGHRHRTCRLHRVGSGQRHTLASRTPCPAPPAPRWAGRFAAVPYPVKWLGPDMRMHCGRRECLVPLAVSPPASPERAQSTIVRKREPEPVSGRAARRLDELVPAPVTEPALLPRVAPACSVASCSLNATAQPQHRASTVHRFTTSARWACTSAWTGFEQASCCEAAAARRACPAVHGATASCPLTPWAGRSARSESQGTR